MNKNLKRLLGATALALSCHAPASFAAYAVGSADAALTVSSSNGFQLIQFVVPASGATAGVGDSMPDAFGDVVLLSDGVFVTGTVIADSLFPPASNSSASFSSVQPLFVLNTSGAANTLELAFDWFFTVDVLSDFVAPVERASASATVTLSQTLGGLTEDLFRVSSGVLSIADGGFSDGAVTTLSYTLQPGELASFLVGVNLSAQAVTAVPVPAALVLFAPAVGLLGFMRRRVRA